MVPMDTMEKDKILVLDIYPLSEDNRASLMVLTSIAIDPPEDEE